MGTASVFTATIRLRDVFTSPLRAARFGLAGFARELRSTASAAFLLTRQMRSLSRMASQLAAKQLTNLVAGYKPYIAALKQIYGLWVKIRRVALIGVGYGVLGLMGGVAAGMAAVTAVGVRFNAQMEQNEMAFTQFLGSTVKAKKYLKDLYTLAAKTPFEFPELTQAARSLMSFGFGAQDAMKTLRSVGDAVAAFGGGAEQIQKIVFALGQIKAKGVPQAEELMQLAEAGIPAYKILQKQLHLTGVQVANIGKSGISSQRVIDALVTGMNERFGGMATKQAGTLMGLWSTLRDFFVKAAGAITKSLMPALKRITQRLIVFTQWVTKVFEGKGSVGDKISKVWDRLRTSFDEWYQKNGDALFRTWGHRIGGGLGKLLAGGTHGSIGRAFWNMGKAGIEALASGFLSNMNLLKVIFSPLGSFIALNVAAAVGPKLIWSLAKMFLQYRIMRKLLQAGGGMRNIARDPLGAVGRVGATIAGGAAPLAARGAAALPERFATPTLSWWARHRAQRMGAPMPTGFPGKAASIEAKRAFYGQEAMFGSQMRAAQIREQARLERAGVAIPGMPAGRAVREATAPLMGPLWGPSPEGALAKTGKWAKRFGTTGRVGGLALKGARRVGRFGKLGAAGAAAGGLGMLTTMLSGGFGDQPLLGAASGALTGASLGSMFGMPGMAVGGLVGAVAGGLASFFGRSGRQGILVKTAPGDTIQQRMLKIQQTQTEQAKQNQRELQKWRETTKTVPPQIAAMMGVAPRALGVRFDTAEDKALAGVWKTNARIVREQMEAGASAIGAAIDPSHLKPFVTAMTYYLAAAKALAPKPRAGALGEAARRAGRNIAQGIIHPGKRGATPLYADPAAIPAMIVSQLKGLPPELKAGGRGGQRRAFAEIIKMLGPSAGRFGGPGAMAGIINQVEALMPGLNIRPYLAGRGQNAYEKGTRAETAVRRQRAFRQQQTTIMEATGQLGIGGAPGGALSGLIGPGARARITPASVMGQTAALRTTLRGYLKSPRADIRSAAAAQLASLNRSTAGLKGTGWTAPAGVPDMLNIANLAPGAPGAPAGAGPGGKPARDPRTAAERMIEEYTAAVKAGQKPMAASAQASSMGAAIAMAAQSVIQAAKKSAETVLSAFMGPFGGAVTLGTGAPGTPSFGAGQPWQPKTGDFNNRSAPYAAGQKVGMQAVNQLRAGAASAMPPGGAAGLMLGAGGGGMPGGVGGNWAGTQPIIMGLAQGTGLPITSQKRPRKNTASGGISDHWLGSTSAYATDLGVTDRAVGDPIAARLAAAVGGSWTPGQWTSSNRDGYRFQVGWQVPDHYDHIHLGARKLHGGGQYRAPSQGGEGYALLRDREKILPASASNPAGGGSRPIIIHYHGEKAGPVDVKKIAGELAGMIDVAQRNYSSVGRRIDE